MGVGGVDVELVRAPLMRGLGVVEAPFRDGPPVIGVDAGVVTNSIRDGTDDGVHGRSPLTAPRGRTLSNGLRRFGSKK